MKYILAILLSISLYCPDIARLFAYADYVVDVVSAEKINLCDCQDVLEQKETTADHQKHIILTPTEWTYILTEAFILPSLTNSQKEKTVANVHNRLQRISFDIFQPPRV